MFTGDVLFVGGHPVVWAGPVGNWVAACDQIIAWDVETVVPGHGPITDKKGVQAMKDYLLYIKAEARRRYDAGMPVFAAARDIALDRFAGWGDPERMVVNVALALPRVRLPAGARHHGAVRRDGSLSCRA